MTASGALRVVLVLKTSEGGLWALPHIEELRARGHQVTVVLPAGPGRLRTALTERGVPAVDSPFDFRFRPSVRTLVGLRRLRRTIRRLRPNVLHYHLYASALAARLSSIGLGVARVHMVAGPLYLDSPLLRTVERGLARLDTQIIAGSRFTARWYRELGVPAERVSAVPYGLDTQRFQPLGDHARQRVRAELGIGEREFVVVMVALWYAPKRLVHVGRAIKGHDVLLRAWTEFHAAHPASRLVLVGSGFDADGERHRRELLDSVPTDGIHLLGTVDDVRPYYAAADLSVSPSLSDNHGSAVEAGAMAVPSIVSDAGALPETVDECSGWTVPRDDADALAAAMAQAYTEFRRGVLAERGARARTLVLQGFAGSRSAADVADTIERAVPGSSCTVFTEARFARHADGGWSALDPANAAEPGDRYARAGRRVRIVARTCERPGAVDPPDGVELVPLPWYVGGRGLVRNVVPVTAAVWRAVRDADAVVLRLPGAVGSLAALACRVLRRRYAVEVVGDPADVLRAGVLGRAGRMLTRPAAALMRQVVLRADASLFVTRRALQRRYPSRPGTPTLSLSRVRLGADWLAVDGRRWAAEPFDLIAVGSHETRYKGHDVLLRAVRELRDSGLDVTVTIVGDGRLRHELVVLANTLGLAGHVTFTGAVHDRDRLRHLLDAASLFVMPSRTEGMPRALIEAMARALPAVGSRVGGIEELLDRSCLVPPGDPSALAAVTKQLLTDPAAWEGQSRRNLRAAHSFEDSLLDARFDDWLSQVPLARRRL